MKSPKLWLGIATTVLLLALAGPRVEIDTNLRPIHLPDDLDAYLAAAEAQLPDLIPGTEKSIVWAAEPGRQTAFAIVYLHGFSATRQEMAPLADQVAGALGANLFYTRFRGHGRGGNALAEASVNDWLNDAWEALAIGQRLGKHVLLIGASNGGAAASWLATQPGTEDLFALILISPNFGPRDAMAEVLTWPWAGIIAKAVVGREYAWTPRNARHARYWTHRYPSSALLAMMGMVKLARDSDLDRIAQPLLVLYSPEDQVVDPRRIETAFARFGSTPKELVAVEDSSDAQHHLLAGDILASADTRRVSALILRFVRSLESASMTTPRTGSQQGSQRGSR